MDILSTLLSATHSRYHKISSSDPHHPPLPNHRHRILDLDRHSTRKADRRYEAARQAEIDAAKAQKRAQKAARKAERAKKREERKRKKEERERQEEEREREEEANEKIRQRAQAVEEKKEKNRREGELWRGRYGVENLEGYCLEV